MFHSIFASRASNSRSMTMSAYNAMKQHQGWPEPYIYGIYGIFGREITKYTVVYGVYTVGSRSLRKLNNYLAKKRKCLIILGALSEQN